MKFQQKNYTNREGAERCLACKDQIEPVALQQFLLVQVESRRFTIYKTRRMQAEKRLREGRV